VSPVKFELGFYIPEDDILHIRRRENLKSYTVSVQLQHFSVVQDFLFSRASRPAPGPPGLLSNGQGRKMFLCAQPFKNHDIMT
jgi:hypothetical protein